MSCPVCGADGVFYGCPTVSFTRFGERLIQFLVCEADHRWIRTVLLDHPTGKQLL